MTKIHTIIENRFNNTNKLIFLATSTDNIPSIRAMTPYYKDGCFYFISNINSDKVKQIKKNNIVALCGEWFNARGKASILQFNSLDNSLKKEIIKHTKSWIELGNVDIHNCDTCIIKVELSQGYIYENKVKYEI